MSHRLKSTTNVSNEEIIEDLTKNLEDSLDTNESEFFSYPSSSTKYENESVNNEKEQNQASPILDDFEEDITEKAEIESNSDNNDDTVDEVSLKDVEVDLTDDEKAERQIIAEELKKTGNDAFNVGEYKRSIEKYTEGLKICPLQFTQQRSILYCNRSAAKMKMQRYESAARDCSKAIQLNDSYLKAYLRRAQSLEATEKYDESFADFKKILELDPSHKEAQKAMTRLPPLIEASNEKLKTEVIDKLKGLGNMILKPFGLSTENFKFVQDPESKGYKVNFQN